MFHRTEFLLPALAFFVEIMFDWWFNFRSVLICFFTCSAVLQLCYNQLTGSIPTQLGDLKKLSVLALQSNQLAGAIPAILGDLGMLTRLDLSSNSLFGSIPTKLANLPSLQVLDVHNNTLSGNVPTGIIMLFYCFCPFLY